MNTRHAVTKLQGYNKVPPDRANYKVENDISENGHNIEHLHDAVHNSFVVMKDNAIKLGRVLIENGAVESGSDVITPFTDEEGESKEFNARYGDFIDAIENLSCDCYSLEVFN